MRPFFPIMSPQIYMCSADLGREMALLCTAQPSSCDQGRGTSGKVGVLSASCRRQKLRALSMPVALGPASGRKRLCRTLFWPRWPLTWNATLNFFPLPGVHLAVRQFRRLHTKHRPPVMWVDEFVSGWGRSGLSGQACRVGTRCFDSFRGRAKVESLRGWHSSELRRRRRGGAEPVAGPAHDDPRDGGLRPRPWSRQQRQ